MTYAWFAYYYLSNSPIEYVVEAIDQLLVVSVLLIAESVSHDLFLFESKPVQNHLQTYTLELRSWIQRRKRKHKIQRQVQKYK